MSADQDQPSKYIFEIKGRIFRPQFEWVVHQCNTCIYTIDDCLSGYALKFEAYGFRLIGSNKDNICFYGKNNETNFVLYNVTDLRFKNGDYKILYGQNNSFVRLRAEYA